MLQVASCGCCCCCWMTSVQFAVTSGNLVRQTPWQQCCQAINMPATCCATYQHNHHSHREPQQQQQHFQLQQQLQRKQHYDNRNVAAMLKRNKNCNCFLVQPRVASARPLRSQLTASTLLHVAINNRRGKAATAKARQQQQQQQQQCSRRAPFFLI